MDLKTQLKIVAKNHQASFQNLKTKLDRLVDKQSGRPSGSLPSNTQPNPKGHNSKAYQPPQALNEHENTMFTRSGKSYNPPVNPNDQQENSKILVNFDSDDEDNESTPQPKTQNPKPAKKLHYPNHTNQKSPGMPNYGKFLKELISNKHKIKQIAAAFISDESSAMIQNKVPSKLGDPGSFLIPRNFNKTFSCNALADLGASINLMPYLLYAKLSLETLEPTKMSVRLADRSFQYPVGIAKNMLVEVEEDFDALLDEGSKILHLIEGTLLEEEIFAEFDELLAMTADENSDSESNIEEPPCMLVIFHDMIEESVEVFMEDFFDFGNSFETCLNNLDKMLQHCKDAHLVLNWEKCHFMVKEGIVLGHKVSSAGLEVDKAKINVILKLPPLPILKVLEAFSDMPVFTNDS
uniref:Reverse transcriptase domain-containing protein n=1 Tax=Tanacetum cinerariifolium TaxID=118510 RepID=A0A6L2NVY8_TANCI|nr:reverse transcriptase domain-containing protein [Tanacetum cinerariifolium]